MCVNDRTTSCELSFEDESERVNQQNEILDLNLHHDENSIPNQEHGPSNDESTATELRLRLHRRNQLLDEIRMAYHRDVLKLREVLIQMSFPTCAESIDGCQSTALNVGEILKSIPSIDLRNPGFHIFAPEQCELKIKPCIYCGGTLEIVHRESSKVLNLIESCDLLKSKEQKLDKLLMEKEEQVYILQESLLREESKSLMCSNAFNKKILDLEKKVEDRDFLYESGQRQSEKIQDLERILKEKEGIEETLITKNRVNEDKIKLLQQVNSELKYTNCELENRIQTLDHQLLDLSSKTEEMTKLIVTLEELEQQLMVEIETSKGSLRRQSSVIKQSEHDIRTLQMQLSTAIKEKRDIVEVLEAKVKDTNLLVSTLEQDLEKKVAEAMDLEIRHNKELERIHQAEYQRAAADKDTIDMMRNKVEALTNLTASYAQGLYDHCLAQEKMLKLENALPDLIQHHRPLQKRNKSEQGDDRQESALNIILGRLRDRVESTQIPWESLLENETDRRKVLVNLSNRVQINQEHYDNMVRSLHKKYQHEMSQSKKELMKTIEMDKEQYTEKIKELESVVQNQRYNIQNLERISNDLRHSLENSRLSNEELKARCEQKSIYVKSLEKDVNELRTQVSCKEKKISDLSNELSKYKEENSQYQVDIQVQNETLLHLESCLQKTTHRYRERLEQEERRLATNINVGVQVKPSVCHAQQQIDFVTAGTSVANGNTVANRLFGFPAV